MSRDVRDLLRQAALQSRGGPDLEMIERRVRRRRTVRVAGVAAGVLVLAGGVVGSVLQLTDDGVPLPVIEEPDPAPTPSALPTGEDTEPPVEETSPRVPADSADLPHPLVASIPGLVELDPVTGALLRELDGPTGEGWAAVALTPDGTTVFHEELWTGCATRLWRTPLDGGEPELLAAGMRPAVSPDGATLAYVGFAPCVPDDHRLVLRDLESGDERSWPLTQPAEQLARIATLSWAPNSRTLAVEVTGTPREEGHVGPPTTSAFHLVDTTSDPRPVQESPSVGAGDHTVQWQRPTYRGDRGTLLVVELCCDIGMGGADPHDDAETYAILEVAPGPDGDPAKVLQVLYEGSSRIVHLDADLSGDHILFVEEEPKQPGRAARALLQRLTDGVVVTLAEDAYAADWGPASP